MSIVQSNTRSGKLPFEANEDLTGKEGFVVGIVNSATAAKVAVPTAIDAITPYIVDKGGPAGSKVDVIPLDPNSNHRAIAKGAGNAGAVLVHAAPGTAGDRGKLRTIPATAGTYYSPGIAEEPFVDGQHVRFRPFPRMIVIA